MWSKPKLQFFLHKTSTESLMMNQAQCLTVTLSSETRLTFRSALQRSRNLNQDKFVHTSTGVKYKYRNVKGRPIALCCPAAPPRLLLVWLDSQVQLF